MGPQNAEGENRVCWLVMVIISSLFGLSGFSDVEPILECRLECSESVVAVEFLVKGNASSSRDQKHHMIPKLKFVP